MILTNDSRVCVTQITSFINGWVLVQPLNSTVYPKKYAHGFVVLCFVVIMQSFIINSHEVFIHIHQGCFAGTGAIVRLPQCQWSKPDGYGKISQCITTTKHSKAKTVCIFPGIYCTCSGCYGYETLRKMDNLPVRKLFLSVFAGIVDEGYIMIALFALPSHTHHAHEDTFHYICQKAGKITLINLRMWITRLIIGL